MEKTKIKKRFRILKIYRGKIIVYQAQMKNIFWRSFWCGSNGVLYYRYSPTNWRNDELSSIEYCRLLKGWEKDEIKIEDDFEIGKKK